MADTVYFPRHIILAGAGIFGVLMALAIHILMQRFGFNIGGLWIGDAQGTAPARAALAWWILAMASFAGGYATASLMHRAVSGHIPLRMRQFLIGVGVLLLAAAGQAASAPSAVPSLSGLLAGIAALCLGAAMAFCGAHFALRRI
jgi:hypothetical protein